MRRSEDAAGHEGAVCYVDSFATSDGVADGVADGEASLMDIAWCIPIKIPCLALTRVNYGIANTSSQEGLEKPGVELPIDNGYEIDGVDDYGRLNILNKRVSKSALVVGEPDKFEKIVDETFSSYFALAWLAWW